MEFVLSRGGHFRYFLVFSLIKNEFVPFFIKLIWLGVGFLNRTGAEIGYQLDKSAKKSFFIIEKMKKYRKCPPLPMIFIEVEPHRTSRKKSYLRQHLTGSFFIN